MEVRGRGRTGDMVKFLGDLQTNGRLSTFLISWQPEQSQLEGLLKENVQPPKMSC